MPRNPAIPDLPVCSLKLFKAVVRLKSLAREMPGEVIQLVMEKRIMRGAVIKGGIGFQVFQDGIVPGCLCPVLF